MRVIPSPLASRRPAPSRIRPRFLWLLGMKLLRFLGSYEHSPEYNLYVEREDVPILSLPFVPFALLVALAIPALTRGLRGAARAGGSAPLNAAAWLLLLALFVSLLTVLVFFVSSRYRLPSVPTLAAFAGSTLVEFAGAIRARRLPQVYRNLAVIGLVFSLAHFEIDASSVHQEASVHFSAGSAWAKKGMHERAVAEFRRAVWMDDSRYDAWFDLGEALRALKRSAEAAVAYGQAVRVHPGFFDA